MVQEKFPQFTKIAANYKEAKVRDTVLAQNQRFNGIELLDCLEIVVSDLTLGQIYFLSVGVDYYIFKYCSLGTHLRIGALHH